MASALAALIVLVATVAHAADAPVPLTDQHWREAPSIVLEQESGIPAPVIEQWQRRERERDPYPSIPGDSAEPFSIDDVHRRPHPRLR